MTDDQTELAACGCVINGIHRHACAGVGHVDPPRKAADLSVLDIVRSIGWLDGFDSAAAVEFDSADWTNVEEDRLVTVEGYTADRDQVVYATFKLVEASVSPADPSWDEYVADEDEEDPDA